MGATIEIVVSQNGDVVVEVNGAKGGECIPLTEFLEKSLGVVAEKKMKSDFYEAETINLQECKVEKG